MRPVSLEFQAFGPYAGKEFIDFSDLSRKGLLLICGDTGSGKTMILDAMTQALYGKSSGGARNDFSSLRCNRCNPEDDTYVIFIFEANGRTYRFEHRLEKKRVNLVEKQTICVMDENGHFEPVLENVRKKDVPAYAEKLIGLDYDQFTQVIILPQGKFERFLESDSGQKGEILTEIFGTEKWDKVAKAYYKIAKERIDELLAVRDRVNSLLSVENCETIDELGQKEKEAEKELSDLESAFSEAGYPEKRRSLLEEKNAAGRLAAARETLQARQEEQKQAQKSVHDCRAAAELSEAELAAHKNHASEKEAWNQEKIALESKTNLYILADEGRHELEEADLAWKNAMALEEKAERDSERAQQQEKHAFEAYEEADRQHKQVLEAFARGAAGRLAAELEEGKKCPVCGSTHHPQLAKSGPDSVSSDQVDKKFALMEKAHNTWEQARMKTEEARKSAENCRSECARCETARTKIAQILESRRDNMADGIDSLQELQDRIGSLAKKTAEYEKKLNELVTIAERNRINTAEAEAVHHKAVEETEKAFAEFEDTLTCCRAKDGNETDLNQIEKELRKIEKETELFQSRKGSLINTIERLTALKEKVSADWAEYTTSIAGAESAAAFAKELRGDNGTGLTRYVLGVMFDQVICAANEMLSKVHGGRYSLQRTAGGSEGSRKKGLDLAVRDSFSDSDEMRSAGSLSGGEKFLVSLALSIGLSTIARTDGIHIDAMFIDEGFGSLDENSIGDALDILESIRGDAGSFIGIISHVQILRDSIPSKLIVHKRRKGSSIEYSIG